MILARKTALAMIGESGSRKEALVEDALCQVARHCAEMLRTEGVMLPIIPGETKADHVVRFACAFADKIERKFNPGGDRMSPDQVTQECLFGEVNWRALLPAPPGIGLCAGTHESRSLPPDHPLGKTIVLCDAHWRCLDGK